MKIKKYNEKYDIKDGSKKNSIKISLIFTLFFSIVLLALSVSPVMALTSVTVSPAVASLSSGATLQLTANTFNQNVPYPFASNSWSSNDTSIATVNSLTGIVTAIAPGIAKITVNSTDGIAAVTGTSIITVTSHQGPFILTSVSVILPNSGAPVLGYFTVGDTPTITSAPLDQFNVPFVGATVVWTSSNTTVATINSATGVLTALNAGQTTITANATSAGVSVSGTSLINIIGGLPISTLTRVTVSPSTITITSGASSQFAVALFDQNNNSNIFMMTPVNWSSSNNAVANVSQSGLVTAKSVGSVTITATATVGANTVSGVSSVSVIAPAASQILSGISIANLSSGVFGFNGITAGTSQQLTALPLDQFNVPFAGPMNISWSSSNTSVATVSQSGLLTGVFPGTATINVTAINGANIVYGTMNVQVNSPGFSNFNITSSAGAFGNITPLGITQVLNGGSQSYIITPNVNYLIGSVLVDGVSVGNVSSYLFTNVNANHTISATFIGLCQTTADTNNDRIISMSEILSYVSQWKIGTVTNANILAAVGFWKVGVGC